MVVRSADLIALLMRQLQFDMLFGPAAKTWVWHLVPAEWNYQFLLALLPPGAFLGLALLIAGKNLLDERARQRALRQKTVTQEVSA